MSSSGSEDRGRWWGWNGVEAEARLTQAQLDLLNRELGPTEPWPHPTTAGEVALPAAVDLGDRLAGIGDGVEVDSSHAARVTHAVGKSFVDLARLRRGSLAAAPDLVVRPGRREEVAQILRLCMNEGVAVVPFGGGTSVVGGVEALRGDHSGVISLDLGRLRDVEVDTTSLTARLGAGLRGPEVEAALAPYRLSLGHFPQSYELATIGGYAATRSAGQSSTGFGRFDEMVTALEMATPAQGTLSTGVRHTAAGPALREVALGSEGTLGVITDVTVRLRPAPESRQYEAWMAESFEAGAAAIRSLAQAGPIPDIVRLSDREETRISLGMSGAGRLVRGLFDRYLGLRGRSDGALIVFGYEAGSEDVATRRSAVAARMRSYGCASLGRAPGRSWAKGRFHGPYLRDALMDRGVLVETLETAHEWSALAELHREVGERLREATAREGAPGIVMCHLSHAYPDGASLYFTVISRAKIESPVDQWQRIKAAGCEAIVARGATITHHHGVGADHAQWMDAEAGATGLEMIGAVKESLDPTGIMNPGKLLPARGAQRPGNSE